ncbi:MAG: hypothetical protein ONB42_20075 [candidate division KSB1 bacterium]|nr:hypothetical protein [candidate division KSB1 bacterium]
MLNKEKHEAQVNFVNRLIPTQTLRELLGLTAKAVKFRFQRLPTFLHLDPASAFSFIGLIIEKIRKLLVFASIAGKIRQTMKLCIAKLSGNHRSMNFHEGTRFLEMGIIPAREAAP